MMLNLKISLKVTIIKSLNERTTWNCLTTWNRSNTWNSLITLNNSTTWNLSSTWNGSTTWNRLTTWNSSSSQNCSTTQNRSTTWNLSTSFYDQLQYLECSTTTHSTSFTINYLECSTTTRSNTWNCSTTWNISTTWNRRKFPCCPWQAESVPQEQEGGPVRELRDDLHKKKPCYQRGNPAMIEEL